MQRRDVIIVGAGPSGSSTALHLVHRDPGFAARVLILEKATHPRPKLCGGGLTELGLGCLRRIGLDPKELPHVEIEDLVIVRGRWVNRQPRGYGLTIFRRDVLDAWLAKQAMDRGVELRSDEAVLEVSPRRGGIEVVTTKERYLARTVVAADGSKGIVRRKLGLEDKERVARALEILMPVEDDGSRRLFDTKTAIFDFSAATEDLQGYYWDFPCWVDGRPHINRGVFDARIVPERPRADLKDILEKALAARGLDLEKAELMGHPLHWFEEAGRFSLPHVLLVGDAAGADPFIGEGIAFALGYGDVAASAIIDAFSTRDFRYADYGARVLRSEYGETLALRTAQARQIYRHKNPLLVPLFKPAGL